MVQRLKEKLKECKVLDRHLKHKNTRLKEHFHAMDQKVIKIKGENKFPLKKARK